MIIRGFNNNKAIPIHVDEQGNLQVNINIDNLQKVFEESVNERMKMLYISQISQIFLSAQLGAL